MDYPPPDASSCASQRVVHPHTPLLSYSNTHSLTTLRTSLSSSSSPSSYVTTLRPYCIASFFMIKFEHSIYILFCFVIIIRRLYISTLIRYPTLFFFF